MNSAIDAHTLAKTADVAFVLILTFLLIRQCRKPTSLPGRLIVQGMNRGHLALTRWGLTNVQIATDSTILDVGCGGGRTIATLAALASNGKVHGIDYSNVSVAAARATNARCIEEGHVEIQLGSVSSLPFADDTFDVVTAIETHYYWPSFAEDLREVRRVMKPGGTFVIIAEAFRGRRMDWLYWPVMRLLRARYLTLAEHGQFLAESGFSEVDVIDEPRKGWMRATGRKPS